MTTIRRLSVVVCLLAVVVACAPEPQFRALPAPTKRETPAANPPFSIRQKNWAGKGGDGSCVHASLSTMLHWQNQFEKAAWWRTQYGGGEYSARLRGRLDDAKIPYAFTEKANLQLLDDAHASRRAALLWWKPSHCCNFVGWAKSPDGRVYAMILDNNRTDKYELVERSEFHKKWASYGGFALMVLYDPPSCPVWKSYERVEDQFQW